MPALAVPTRPVVVAPAPVRCACGLVALARTNGGWPVCLGCMKERVKTAVQQ